MKVWPVFGLPAGVDGGVSGFLGSFEPGVTAAPNGFEYSGLGLAGGDFAGFGDVVDGPGAVGFELDENFELILDIHEFLLPRDATLGSLVFLEELVFDCSLLSEMLR